MSRLCRTAAIVGMLALIGIFGATLGTSLAFAADLPLVSGHSETQSPGARATRAGAQMRLEEFAKGPNATCTAWTDGCRSCGSGAGGVFCSNIGIACVPSEPRCTRP
jgi:hypothetical protein